MTGCTHARTHTRANLHTHTQHTHTNLCTLEPGGGVMRTTAEEGQAFRSMHTYIYVYDGACTHRHRHRHRHRHSHRHRHRHRHKHTRTRTRTHAQISYGKACEIVYFFPSVLVILAASVPSPRGFLDTLESARAAYRQELLHRWPRKTPVCGLWFRV